MPKSQLAAKTLELLANRPKSLTYADIEQATGLKERWLSSFASGAIDNASVSKVEQLYAFLSGRPLNVA